MSNKVIIMRHPFRADKEELHIDCSSIKECIELSNMCNEIPVIAIVGDQVVDQDYELKEDDVVILRAVPSGGGGGGKDESGILGAVLGATMVVVGALLILSPGMGAVGAGLIAGGLYKMSKVSYGAEVPDIDDLASLGSDYPQLPGLRGSRNSMAPGAIIPLVLGKHHVVPPMAAMPYTSYITRSMGWWSSVSTQRLHQMFITGYAPLHLSDFRIGESPTGNYEDVLYHIRDGSTAATSLYRNLVASETVGLEIDFENDPIERTTSDDINEIEIDLSVPRGLVKYNDKGDMEYLRAYILLQIYDGTTILYNENFWYSGNSLEPFGRCRSYSVTRQVGKSFTIKISRVGTEYEGNKVDTLSWDSFRSIKHDTPVSDYIAAKINRVALRIQAEDQLHGVVNEFNYLAEAEYKDWNGSAWVSQKTRNPASAFLHALQGPHLDDPVPDSKIDWTSLQTWHEWCDSEGFECNAVIDRAMPLERLINNIASTGRASWSVQDDKYRIVQDVPRATPVQMITPRNAWNLSGNKTYVNAPHALRISFVNEEIGYQSDERIVYNDGYNEGNATVFEDMPMWGITNPDQIWKQGRYLLGVALLRPEMYSATMDVEHIICQRGDAVLFQFPGGLIGTQTGRIKSITVDGGNIDEIELDEAVQSTGANMAMRVRDTDGVLHLLTVGTTGGMVSTFSVVGTVSEGAVEVGDLAAIGEPSLETIQCIVTGIEVQDDLTAQLTLVVDHPGVYTADSGTIPEFVSSVTAPGDKAFTVPPTPVITSVWSDDHGADIQPDGTVNWALKAAVTVPTSPILLRSLHVQARVVTTIEEEGEADVLLPAPWQKKTFEPESQLVTFSKVSPGDEVTIQARLESDLGIIGPFVETTHTVTGMDNTIVPVTIPHFSDLDEGWESTLGTVLPNQLTVAAVGFTRTIAVRWIRQTDLTNLQQYEIQVTDDSNAEINPETVSWYSLRRDGVDWKETIDEVTLTNDTTILHENIPHNGTEDEPDPRQLWYRVRQRTKKDVASTWSAVVTASTTPIDTPDLKAGSVTADKLVAAILEALFANITEQVTIGLEGLIGESEDGLWRMIIRRSSLQIQSLSGSVWTTVGSIGAEEGGLDAVYGHLRGIITPGVDQNDFDIGFRAGDGSRVFDLNNSYEDKGESDPFTTKTNLAFDDTTKKFGSHSLTAAGGEGVLTGPDLVNLSNDWAMNFWMYRDAYDPEAQVDIFDVEVVADVAGNLHEKIFTYQHSDGVPRLTAPDNVGVQMREMTPVFTDVVTGTPILPDKGLCVDFSPDGAYIAAGHEGSPFFTVIDTSDWSVVTGTPTTFLGHVNGVAFSPDGAYIAAVHPGAGPPYLTVINTSDWSVVSGTPPLPATAYGVAFSPDGAYIAAGHSGSGTEDIYLTVIDTSDWSVVSGTPTIPGTGRDPAFSLDGAYLAVGCGSEPFLVVINTSDWSVVSGTPTLPGTGRGPAFSPDGAYLAVAYSGTPRLTVIDTSDWSVVSGTPTLPNTGMDVAFSSDGAYLAVAHFDTPYLTVIDTSDWSVVTGTPTLSNTGYGVAFSHDGDYLAAVHNWSPRLTVIQVHEYAFTPSAAYDQLIVAEYLEDDTAVAIATAIETAITADDPLVTAFQYGDSDSDDEFVAIETVHPVDAAPADVDTGFTITRVQNGFSPNIDPPRLIEIGSDIIVAHHRDGAADGASLFVDGAYEGSLSVLGSGWSLVHLEYDTGNLVLWVNGSELTPVAIAGAAADITLKLDIDREIRIDELMVLDGGLVVRATLDDYLILGIPWAEGIDYQNDLLLAAKGPDGRVVVPSPMALGGCKITSDADGLHFTW